MVKRCLDSHTQKVMVDGSCSIWRSVASGKLQGVVLGPVLVNIFINELAEVTEHVIIKCVDETKLGGDQLILLEVGSHPERPGQARGMGR